MPVWSTFVTKGAVV